MLRRCAMAVAVAVVVMPEAPAVAAGPAPPALPVTQPEPAAQLEPAAQPEPAPASGPEPVPGAAPALPPRLSSPTAWTVNLELLGRSGLWGVGVERELAAGYYVGGLGSVALLRGDQVYAASAYTGMRLLGTRHVVRADVGVTLAHVRTPSPVPEWDGATHTGVSAVLGGGYEYRGRLRWRASMLLMVGKGGVAPWPGLSAGYPF